MSAVLGNKFSGQPIPYPEATSLPCFRSYVAPLLFNWLDAWQDAVRRGSCTLLPFVWMEELRQQAASNCPAALATWHSEQGSLEEPRYMASNSTSWIHSECGRCEWPSCELQALWSPEAAYGGSWGANSSETALDVAQVASNSMDLPRRLANRTLIAGVLNRFSRRWGSDYQSDNSRSMSAAAPADPLASLALLPACFYTYTARSGLKLLDVIEDASSHFAFVALGQRALLPDDVLAQCMEGKVRAEAEPANRQPAWPASGYCHGLTVTHLARSWIDVMLKPLAVLYASSSLSDLSPLALCSVTQGSLSHLLHVVPFASCCGFGSTGPTICCLAR